MAGPVARRSAGRRDRLKREERGRSEGGGGGEEAEAEVDGWSINSWSEREAHWSP